MPTLAPLPALPWPTPVLQLPVASCACQCHCGSQYWAGAVGQEANLDATMSAVASAAPLLLCIMGT